MFIEVDCQRALQCEFWEATSTVRPALEKITRFRPLNYCTRGAGFWDGTLELLAVFTFSWSLRDFNKFPTHISHSQKLFGVVFLHYFIHRLSFLLVYILLEGRYCEHSAPKLQSLAFTLKTRHSNNTLARIATRS
jgi:hypothetical protein